MNKIYLSQMDMNKQQKSSILWNIVEPDDPYDIRKSMIAKLPEHNKNFMGSHLQLVCMMQAAQIQRISEYLEEYKVKYREFSRKDLDRHSYQIQIKQLTEKNQVLYSFRTENEKLKDFIKKQSIEMEELVRNKNSHTGEYIELRSNYQALLIQLKSCRESLTTAQFELQKVKSENRELKIKYDSLDKRRLNQLTMQRQKYEMKIKQRIDLEVREVSQIYETRLNRLQSDCRLFREQIESKNLQISTLLMKVESINQQIFTYEQQSKTKQVNELKNQELERINSQLSIKVKQLENVYLDYQKMQHNFYLIQNRQGQVEKERDQLQVQLQRINRRGQQQEHLQNKIALLSSQVQRLSFILEQKNKQNSSLLKRCNESENHYQVKQISLNQELYLLRQRVKELQFKNSQNSQLQQSLNNLSLEIEKLNAVIRGKTQQIDTLETKLKIQESSTSQLETIKNLLYDKDRLINKLQGENKNLGDKLSQLEKDSLIEIKNLTFSKNQINQQIEFESNQNKILVDQINRMTQQKMSIEHNLNLYIQKNKEMEDKIAGYDSSFAPMSQEIERLKNVIVQRDSFIDNLKVQLDTTKQELEKTKNEILLIRRDSISQSKVQVEVKRRIQVYQQRCSRLQLTNRTLIENEGKMSSHIHELEKQVSILQAENQKSRDYIQIKERQITTISRGIQEKYFTQIQILNQKIKALVQQTQKEKEEKKRLYSTIENLQKTMYNKEKQFGQYRTQYLREYQERIEMLQKENQRLKRQVNEKQAQAKIYEVKLIEVKKQIEDDCLRVYTNQLNGKDQIILSLQKQLKHTREQMRLLQVSRRQAEKNMENFKERLLMISSQMERLTALLSKKNEEIQQLHVELTKSSQKAQSQQIMKLELSKYHEQMTNLRRDIQIHIQTIQTIQHEKEEMMGGVERKNESIRELERKINEFKKFEIEATNLRLMLKELEQIHQHTTLERDQLFDITHQLQNSLKVKENQISIDETRIYKMVQEKLYLKHHQQLQELERKLTSRFIEQRSSITQHLQIDLKVIKQERDRLRQQYQEKSGQFDEINMISHEYQERIKALESQLRGYNLKGDQFRKINTEYHELSIKFKKYEQQLSLASTEIERLNLVIKDREKESTGVAELRREIEILSQKLQLKTQQAQQWATKYTNLFYTYQEIGSMHERLKKQYDNSRLKITEYQNQLTRLQTEFQNLNRIMHSLKIENISLKEELNQARSNLQLEEKNLQLSAQIDRLIIMNQALKQQISDVRIRLSDQISLQKRLQQYISLIVILFAEIESLRKRVQDTEKECDNVRRSSLTPYRIDRKSLGHGKK